MRNHMLPLDAFLSQVNENPEKPFIHQPVDGAWSTYSLKDIEDRARKIAGALMKQGYNPGDRIALLSKNCVEWVISDLAMMMAGFVSVPIYPSAGPDTINHILSHSGAAAILLGPLDDYSILSEADIRIPKIKFEACPADADVSLRDLLANQDALQELHKNSADDLFTIVYTSGSTGLAKGVCLSYGNVRATSIGNTIALGGKHSRQISYLPLAHIAERTFSSISSLYNSVEMFFVESLETFSRDLHYANVTIFIAVPRLWSKFQSSVIAHYGEEQLEALLSSEKAEQTAAEIRSMMGWENCRIFASGTAPTAASILNWYSRIGVDITEAWGMTETGGTVCNNLPFKHQHLGSCGRVVEGFEMTLSDDGEILVRGAGLFAGYYNNSEANEASFIDGWFRTGDKGVLVDGDAWKITGRVKEQFKTTKGKYVAPIKLESLLLTSAYIEQVCVCGSGMAQPIGLVVMPLDADKHDEQKISDSLTLTMDEVNSELEAHEKLSGLLVVDGQWTIENSLLTPTMKLKRDHIESRYLALYSNVSGVVWESNAQS